MRRPVAVRVVGPMQWIIYPTLITAAVTFLLATPVKVFGLSLPEPIIPLVLAFAWPLIRPSIIAPVMLMVLGLFLNFILGGTLGLWSLALLAVYTVVLFARSFLIGQDTVILFVWYAACCGLAFTVAYIITTVIAGRPPSLLALVGQVLPTLLLFPFADRMIERFEDGDVRFR
jgi:rod shape-determining protein MreD